MFETTDSKQARSGESWATKKQSKRKTKKPLEIPYLPFLTGKALGNYVQKYRLYIGMALASLGAGYQIINVVKWGWWQPQGTIDYVKGLTQQQQFALDWGFLAIPFFIVSFVVLIVGIALWFTDKS